MPNKPRTPLQKLYSTDYDMSFNEKVAGAALKLYFLEEPEKSKKAIAEIFMKHTFMLNPALDKPVFLAADVDGRKLAELIDMAANYSAAMTVQSGMEAENPSYHLMTAMAALKVDGTDTVANVSQGFCDYLVDCFGALAQ